MDEIRRFLTALFEYKTDEHYILVWTLAGRKSAWFTDIEAAARYIELHKDEDCYVGGGLASKDYGPFNRAPANEIAAMGGFYADIDYGARKRPDSPDKEQALEFLHSAPIRPSMIVNSGHGYHGWWLFDEPWLMTTDKERNEAHWVLQHWGQTLKTLAAERGFTIDAVFDLARVMRCPGSLNRKEEPHVRAELLEVNDWRAGSLEPFYEHIREESPEKFDAAPTMIPGSNLTLNPAAEPSLTMFDALRANNKQFEASYNHDRKDTSGWTNSEYDLSLASFAMRANWNDQEIVNLIISSRRKAGEDLKLRPDYYQRTLNKARQDMARAQVVEDMAVIEPGAPETPDLLATYLNIRIERVIRYQKPDGTGLWYVVVAGRRVKLGPITNVRTMNKFLASIEDATLRHIKVDKGDWDKVLDLVYGMAEMEDMGEDGDETQITASWLEQYLGDYGKLDPDGDTNSQAIARRPFVWNDTVWISLSAFREWVFNFRQEQVYTTTLAAALKELGSTSRGHPATTKERRTTYNVWSVPDKIGRSHIAKSKPSPQPVAVEDEEKTPDWWKD